MSTSLTSDQIAAIVSAAVTQALSAVLAQSAPVAEPVKEPVASVVESAPAKAKKTRKSAKVAEPAAPVAAPVKEPGKSPVMPPRTGCIIEHDGVAWFHVAASKDSDERAAMLRQLGSYLESDKCKSWHVTFRKDGSVTAKKFAYRPYSFNFSGAVQVALGPVDRVLDGTDVTTRTKELLAVCFPKKAAPAAKAAPVSAPVLVTA